MFGLLVANRSTFAVPHTVMCLGVGAGGSASMVGRTDRVAPRRPRIRRGRRGRGIASAVADHLFCKVRGIIRMTFAEFGRDRVTGASAEPAAGASVLFVAFHFAPENTSGTHRPLHFARALEDAGYRVWVISGPTGAMRYTDPALSQVFPWPERIVRPNAAPTISGAYRLFKRMIGVRGRDSVPREQRDAPGGGDARRGLLQRLRAQVAEFESLPDVHRGWYRRAVRAGVRVGRRERVAAVFVSGPPWTAMRVGHRVAARLGVPLIADFRDPWSVRTGAVRRRPHAWAQRKLEEWEGAALEDARIALFNSPVIAAAALRTASRGDTERIRVLLNGTDVPLRRGSAPMPATPPLRIRHFGTLYIGRSIDPLVSALEELVANRYLQPGEVEVEQVGEADPGALEVAALRKRSVEVRALASIPFAEAAARMAEPALLLMVQPEWASPAIPSKLYDYLATGNPVLVMAGEGSASWSVAREFGRCTLLRPERHPENATVLLGLIESWRRGSLRQEDAAHDAGHLAKAAIGASFVDIVRSVLGAPHGQ